MLEQRQGKLNAEEIVRLFDGMAEEYDEITDLWYAWLFCRLHYFLVLALARMRFSPAAKCLDVGCGTGFQSMLLNLYGYDSVGIDVATKLLDKARQKRPEDYITGDLFRASFDFAHQYGAKIRNIASEFRQERRPGKPVFEVASATNLPFKDCAFDIVNCCGSTLSFVNDYTGALQEMVRVLKPGGLFFLEVETKHNPDFWWSFLDSRVFAGRLRCETVPGAVFRDPAKHPVICYPFSMKTREVEMPFRLFSSGSLLKELESMGLKLQKTWSIHSITNIIPSVYLDRPCPGRTMVAWFRVLSRMEEIVAGWPCFRRFGCSLVIAATKQDMAQATNQIW